MAGQSDAEKAAAAGRNVGVGKPTDFANYKRCGQVSVTNFGIIEIVKGNRDGSNCNQIKNI
ncbi:MAG: hypothetical protein GWO07_06910 [Candidatus Dadabacteria bacterium]|nr:hypothetical protein [Candidatus Dadabacteria bacterium]NIS08480.1 hypothetical protein [Candidatus Dadabacteria bacterium]NIY21968.1 hypothetical protein [Candidatus Dadabacteria bacterium]